MPRLLSLALLGAVACATTPRNASNPSAVQAPIDSVGAMEFGDDDVLFVADNAAGRVHAFDFPRAAFDDQRGYVLGRAETFEGRVLVADIDRLLGQRLGTDPNTVVVRDIVVHAATGQLVLSVQRGLGPDARFSCAPWPSLFSSTAPTTWWR